MLDSKSFVVFASGEGSNALNLFKAAKERGYHAKALIVDREAPVIQRVDPHEVPIYRIRSGNEIELLNLLSELKPKWAFLAGYKKILGAATLDFFKSADFIRILNIHPSLLPAYPGLNGYERAYKDGVRVSGVTVHFVDSGLDTGLSVMQKTFSREKKDSLAEFIAKGKKIEHELFPKAFVLAMEDKLKIIKKENSHFVDWEES